MSKTPIVRPFSWLNAGINIGVLALFVVVGLALNQIAGVFFGALAYVGLSQVLRRFIAGHHRKAIRHCKRQNYQQAIPEFEKSISFFTDNQWIDQFRAITMLSSAGMSYREMAMVSLGFCYAQLGDGAKARENYEQCLREYPSNGMAESALRMLDAGANFSNAN
jgi:tetratricopeptide (TPR) repeat protein